MHNVHTLEEGTQMSHSEHAAGEPAARTKSTATHRSFPRVGRGKRRWLAALAPVIAAMLTGALAFGASPAAAALKYPFVGQITSGLVTAPDADTSKVAVDGRSGDTLVESQIGGDVRGLGGTPVVSVYGPTGSQLATWTGANTPEGSFIYHGEGSSEPSIQEIVANNTNGDVDILVHVQGGTSTVAVYVFDESGAFLCQITGATPVSEEEKRLECNGAAGSATPNGRLSQHRDGGMTVDQETGDIYVGQANMFEVEAIEVFSPSGAYLRQITPASTPTGKFLANNSSHLSLAVDDATGDLLLGDLLGADVQVLNAATGAYIETWAGSAATNFPGVPQGSFGEVVALATNDVTGDAYVVDGTHDVVDQLDSTGAYAGQITEVPGRGPFHATMVEDPFSHEKSHLQFTRGALAVAQSTGDLYLVERTQPAIDIFGGEQFLFPDATTDAASEVLPRSATLNGEVNGEGVALTGCHFEYVEAAKYRPGALNPYAAGGTAPCAPSAGEIPLDSSDHAVDAVLGVGPNGLIAGTAYHFRLVATNANGSEFGADIELHTVPPPAIEAAGSADESASSATLEASINPNGLATTYRFEYGTSTAYGASAPVPDGSLSAGTAAVHVSQAIGGLSPNVTYHWRAVATNAAGTTTTQDHSFIYDTSGEGLPEGRAYEMVTPPFKNGGAFGGAQVFAVPSTFSEDGQRVIRTTAQCGSGAESCPGERGGLIGTPYQFERIASGWATTPLAPSGEQFAGNTARGVNPNTGVALFDMPSAMVPGEEDFYAREPGGALIDIGPVIEPGKELETFGSQATPDGSHVLYDLNFADKWKFDKTTGGQSSLYELAGAGNAQPTLVAVSGGLGSTALIGRCGTSFGPASGADTPAAGSSISEDGSTVFFTVYACPGGSEGNTNIPVPAATLYARIGKAETVKLSACLEAGCQASTPANAEFQGAARNGSRAFFTSTQKLTGDATENAEADGTLYEAELGKNASTERSEVKHLSAISAGDGTTQSGVEGVVAIAPDGSHSYFVARGVLTAEARSGCEAGFAQAGVAEEGRCKAIEGANNLYVFERDARYPQGHLGFVATLSSEEGALEGQHKSSDADQLWLPSSSSANVTPSGRFLVFPSDAHLTPDDTDVNQAQQVFRFDDETGELVRVSIGERGFNDNGNAATVDAHIVIRGGAGALVGPQRSDPTMSNDGAYVFFQSPVALAPHALNEVPIGSPNAPEFAQNVYEYHEGNVYLISDGRDTALERTSCVSIRTNSAVCLIGTDATGRNAFFTSADQLVPADNDTQLDVYDARRCGEEGCIQPTPAPQPPCLGEACHGVPAAIPAVPGVPSLSFNGAGNLSDLTPVAARPPARPAPLTNAQKLARALKSCHKQHKRRERVKCERSAHQKYGAKKAKKASNGGKAGR
jgi:hypothetical protein